MFDYIRLMLDINNIIPVLLLLSNITLVLLVVSKINLKVNKDILWAKSQRMMKNKNDYFVKKQKLARWKYFLGRFKIVENAKLKMKQAGESREYVYMIYICLAYILPFIMIIVSLISEKLYKSPDYDYITKGVALAFFVSAIVRMNVMMQIKKQELIFKKSSYKLYKFLNNQISAGVRHADAIKSLYKAVEDQWLRKQLKLMAATYISTNDIELSLKYITETYALYEAKSLALAIRQGLESGTKGQALERKERNMFQQYLNNIKKETDMVNVKCVLIAMLFGVVIVISLCYPLVLDMISAQESIFITN